MPRFDFSKLALGGKPKAMDDDEDKAKAEDAPAEDEEDTAADEDRDEEAAVEEEAADDDEEETPQAAYRRGRTAERRRCAAIFAAASPAQVQLAANLAFNTRSSAAEAVAVLQSTPMQASRLDAAMRDRGPKPVGQRTETTGGRLAARMKQLVGKEV